MWDGKAVASGCIQDVLSGHWFGPLHGPHFCPVQRSGVWSLGRAKHFFSRTGGWFLLFCGRLGMQLVSL